MVEFMNEKKCNEYNLYYRVLDCEKCIILFNYITPIAVCIEAMLKMIYLKYDDSLDSFETDKMSLDQLLKENRLKKILLNRFDIDEQLLEKIDTQIRKDSNKYKHSLRKIDLPTLAKKRENFHLFYIFASKYYEHYTTRPAPKWNDSDFMLMCQAELNSIKEKDRILDKIECDRG